MWRNEITGCDQYLITISGEGDCGKGTALAWINQYTKLKGGKSTSQYAADRIFDQIREGAWHHDTRVKYEIPCPYEAMATKYNYHPNMYDTAMECWEDRRNHRAFWADWIDECNRADREGIGLYRPPLNDEGINVLEGIRWANEFYAIRPHVDLSIWIDRPGTKRDPTLQYGPEACDIVIQNPTAEQRDLEPLRLHDRLFRVFSLTGLLR